MNGTFWTTVMHTFEGFRFKRICTTWSEWIHITPQSSFCNFLTSNPEVSGGHSVVVFNDFAQNTPKSARISSSYSIETNITIGKHTLHSFNHVFNCLFGNVCLDVTFMRFITIFCISSHFPRINTSSERNVLESIPCIHTRFQLFVWKCLLGCYIYAVYHHFLHFTTFEDRVNETFWICHAHI